VQARLAARAGVLPLRFQLAGVGGDVPADLLLFPVLFPFTLPHLHARAALRAALGLWLRGAAAALGLAGYLLPAPAGGRPRAPAVGALMAAPAEGAGEQEAAGAGAEEPGAAQAAGAEDGPPDGQGEADAAAARERAVAPRVALLCAGMLVSLVAANTALLAGPLALGRAAFAAAGLPLARHDLYAAAAGGYLLWAGLAAGRALAGLAALRNVRRCTAAVGAWAGQAARLAALGALGLGLLPLLVGLNLDLAMQPFRRAPPPQTLGCRPLACCRCWSGSTWTWSCSSCDARPPHTLGSCA